MDGNMQARLIPRPMVKEPTEENIRIGEEETARCEAAGVSVNKILKLEDLVKNDNVIFSATGITKGDLVDGVSVNGRLATTETLVVRGGSRTVRRIHSTHTLDRKGSDLKDIIL
jgi:fructose-1,6-bisphosphatase II